MDIPFRWWGSDGVMRVEMSVNDDPAKFGCSEMARGFPRCEATPDFPARGYASTFGWVILVKYTQGGDFEIDLRPQFRQEHPFCYFTERPRFFDSPHTDEPELDFLSHTFLCGLGGEILEFRQEAHAILGFGWGFSKRGPDIEFFAPERLSAEDWDHHREYLEGRFPAWTFRPGFSQHPLHP